VGGSASDGHVKAPAPGLLFVEALAAKDREALAALFDPQVDFRGVTPGRAWEASDPEGVVEILLGSWFEPQDHIQETLEADTEPVMGRERLRYRLRVESEGTMYVAEQQGYFDAPDGRITRMSLMCSGFRPVADGAPA